MTGINQDQGREIAALRNRLEQAGISTAEWGRGEAKTLANLAQELRTGDSALVEDNNTLVRTVSVVDADVFYEAPDGLYKLIEQKQVFVDGRERVRKKESSVSEKMLPGDDPTKEMDRGLREELGITGELNMRYEGESGTTKLSPSYPGLTSRYVNYKFTVFLSDEQFKADGYIEVQPEKSTHFIWKRVDPNHMAAPMAANS
jgi:hypothetical protein